MADPNPITDRQQYVNDPRIACKYGAKCYQKNSVHLQKYKHPPPKKEVQEHDANPRKKFKINDKNHINTNKTTDPPNSNKKQPEICDVKTSTGTIDTKNTHKENEAQSDSPNTVDLGYTPNSFDPKTFIKQKFLVEMPDDFYNFWDFCKKLKENCPQEAFKDVGLTLVGPYDVLAGKFYNVPEQPDEQYLIHWRYFYDPPECQTVLKGDDKTGYHIGYYRDSPKELPVFLVKHMAQTDGVFKVVGDNIFAAVYIYLEDMKKDGDPFKKMHIGRLQNHLKKRADELQITLSEKSQKINERSRKIVTRSLNKIGLVIPYNRKTQVGYRDLSVTNKELVKLLDNIQNTSPDQRHVHLSKLQDILTNVSIATDECDFGTGIELGLNILAHGVDSLNHTISRYLAMNYRLIDREEFAKIAEAHMKNRRKGTDLSII